MGDGETDDETYRGMAASTARLNEWSAAAGERSWRIEGASDEGFEVRLYDAPNPDWNDHVGVAFDERLAVALAMAAAKLDAP